VKKGQLYGMGKEESDGWLEMVLDDACHAYGQAFKMFESIMA